MSTVKIRGIERYYLFIVPIAKVCKITAKNCHKLPKQDITISLSSNNLNKGDRIGRVWNQCQSAGIEYLLIDIDSSTDDAIMNMPLRKRILYDGTADFLILPINIIRPFYRYAISIL